MCKYECVFYPIFLFPIHLFLPYLIFQNYMRPTTPIPNGCSFTLLSCRLNYTSPQRFLSPNRTTPQMYRSPDSKKISLKQARSPGSGHQQFNHSF